jgi:hypothetical protein
MSEFTEALEGYKMYDELWMQSRYIGRQNDLQNKYGDLRVLFFDPDTLVSIYKLDEPDLRAAYSDKLVYAYSHSALGSKQIKRARLR